MAVHCALNAGIPVRIRPSEPFVRNNQFADSKGCMDVSARTLPCVSKIRKEKQ